MEIPDVGFEPTLPIFLRRLREQHGDRAFIVTPDERMSFAELDRTSRRVAKQLLSLGAVKGTRIAFMFGNGADWIVTWFAISRIGAIAMPTSTLYKPAELRKVLRIADVEVVITPPTLFGRDQAAFLGETVPLSDGDASPFRMVEAPFLRRILFPGPLPDDAPSWVGAIDLRRGMDPASDAGIADIDDRIDDAFLDAVESEVHPSDPMFTVFTSGTTAEPKAVIHSHGTWIRHGANVSEGADEPYGDVVFGGMPFFWIGGISTILAAALHRGSTVVCTEKTDPVVTAKLIAAENPSRIMMWPTALQRLRETLTAQGLDPGEVRGLRPPPPARRASQLGMTETCAAYIVSGPRDHVIPEEYAGAHGFPVRGMQYRIVDLETGQPVDEGTEGEICVRGYSLMLGMYKKERHEIVDDDGWYRTGDKGFLRGPYIFFTGRAKDLIKASGANVAPREVESALNTVPEVLTSVVVGVPDPERGEVVAAILVPRVPEGFDPSAVIAQAGTLLSSYKIPRRYLVLDPDDLPMLATGKPDLARLRDLVTADGRSTADV